MNTISSCNSDQLFPPADKNWADKLFIAGLLLYAFCSSFSIAASQISLGLAVIAYVALYRSGRVGIKSTAFDNAYAFLVLTVVLSAFRAEMPMRALNEARSFMTILCLYLVFWPNLRTEFRELLVKTFVASSALVALISCSKLFQNLGEGRHAQGFFSMSITYGECQALAALTLIFYLVSHSHSLKKKLLLSMALMLMVTAVILSFTRGAWLGFASGLFVLAAGFPRKILPMLLVFSLLAMLAFNFSPYMRERVAGFNVSKILDTADKSFDQKFDTVAVMSGFHRLYIWLRGFTMIRTSPCFGVGAKNIKYHYNLLANDYERQNGLIWNHQHNNFMQMLVAFGFLGLIAFFYFIILICKYILNKSQKDHPEHNRYYMGALAVFICFMAFGLTENAWGDEEVGMMAFFLTGLLLSRPEGSMPQS
ncbi:MAG: O-antigen polymerase [uncultured bacterium]|nr:MAG: O-antigen polymerase [uncultured bacterium]